MSAQEQLGPGTLVAERYAVEQLLGQGGFGEVWKAQDRVSGQPVALKTILGGGDNKLQGRSRFGREIVTAARLQHPHIVRILDTGLLPDKRPFFTMEFLQGQSLHRYEHQPVVLLELFEQLLEALAYAHARGVVHRDLKPDNVIIVEQDGRPCLKLLDFGVAALDEVGGVTQIRKMSLTRPGAPLGTVSYMSPEQARGEPSAVGPPSDLYSLGVMLYESLTGKLPFDGDWMFVLVQHASHPMPAPEFRPELGLGDPDGFVTLLESLLRKPFVERPECAAHVRHRLALLRKDQTPSVAQRRSEVVVEAFSVDMPTMASDAPPSTGGEPLPWQGQTQSLLRLFEPPLVGRGQEQEVLWSLASEVMEKRSARAVLIAGAPQAGKSRLGRWCFEENHRTGTMRTLDIFVADGGLASAMRGAIFRWLRMPKLERKPLTRRINECLDFSPEDQEALCDFMLSAQGAAANDAQEERQWMRLWQKFVWSISQFPSERPLLLWLDGDEGSAHTLAPVVQWIELLLSVARLSRKPLLVVWTGAVDEPRSLERLAQRPEVSTIDVLAMGDEAQAELARLYEPRLSNQAIVTLRQHTMGSPLFLREVLLEWMESGALEETPEGLNLSERAQLRLPRGLREALTARLDRFVAAFEDPEGVRNVLIRLAFLGQSFPERLVVEVCKGTALSAEVLVAEGFLVRRPGGRSPEVSLDNRMLRQLLEELARQRQSDIAMRISGVELRTTLGIQAMINSDWELAERSMAVAWSMLDQLKLQMGLEGRRLKILDHMAALAWRHREPRALEVRLELIRRLAQNPGSRVAQRAGLLTKMWHGTLLLMKEDFALCQEALSAVLAELDGLQGVDDLKARARRDLALATSMAGDESQARALLRRAVGEFARHRQGLQVPDPLLYQLEADAISEWAQIIASQGELESAIGKLSGVLTLYKNQGDAQGEALTLMRLARVLRKAQQPERSLESARRAEVILKSLDDRRGLALMHWELGSIALGAEAWERADQHYRAASRLFATIGEQTSAAMCANARGEVARKQKRYGDAVAHYAVFRDAMVQANHTHGAGLADINAGWALIGAGRPKEARHGFERAWRTLHADGPKEATWTAMMGQALALALIDEPKEAAATLKGLPRGAGKPGAGLDDDALEALDRLVALARQHGWVQVAAAVSALR